MNPPSILVTGAAGFIGARFVESCRQRGQPVISCDHPEHFVHRFEHRGIDFGPIVDREQLFSWWEESPPTLEAIVHLGACTDTTNLDVSYLTRVNFEYSRQLWDLATKHQIPFVYASSAATYGDGSRGYDDEEEQLPELAPLNPYGDSKQAFDLWALGRESEGHAPPQWCGFKFFNVYGYGERHKKKMASVVLHAFDQIRATGRVKLFRSHRSDIPDGHQSRDFIHSDDVVSVLHFARSRPIERGILNLGTGRARTFLDLARTVFAALDEPEEIEYIDTPPELRERYQYFTEARTNRLVQSQGYPEPFTPLEEGVARTVGLLLADR